MVGGFIKLLYPDGVYTKEQLEEILTISREMLNSIRLLLDELVSAAGWNRNTVESSEQVPAAPVANPATLH